MSRWESPAWVKIHQGCGGRVRWVEAIDTPGVGYTGECLECRDERVVVEEIIPIEVRGEVLGLDLETRRDLEWDESATFDENQRRLRAVANGDEVGPSGGGD